MKCIHCGAEWTTGKDITVLGKCPFCGKTLTVTIEDGKELSMNNILRHMVEVYGTDILSYEKKCIAIFKDIAPELKNEHKILSAALSSGVGDFFTSCPENEREANIKKAIHSIDYLSNDAKSLVVSSLVDAMGWDEKLIQRCFQEEKDDPNESHFSNNLIKNTITTPSENSYQSMNSTTINNSTAPGVSSQSTNNTTANQSFFYKKGVVITASIVAILFGIYMLFGSGKDTSSGSVQSKQITSAVKSNNNVQDNKPMTSSVISNNNTQKKDAKSPIKDVIKEARIRHGLLSPNQNTSNININKYNAKSVLGNPINYCYDSNYILVYEGPGKVEYLIRDTLEYKKNTSGTIVEIEVDTADIEDPKIEKPILIGIGGCRFYFNEGTGVAGTNFGKITTFDSLGNDPSLAYLPQSAAIAYYLATGKKWPKFRYGDDFYSRANL